MKRGRSRKKREHEDFSESGTREKEHMIYVKESD